MAGVEPLDSKYLVIVLEVDSDENVTNGGSYLSRFKVMMIGVYDNLEYSPISATIFILSGYKWKNDVR